MAKAVKTISRAAKLKADAAILNANADFAKDEARIVDLVTGIDTNTDELAALMAKYASDLVRLASIRTAVMSYGMFRWAAKKNAAALAAKPDVAAPYVKCDRAYCATLAAWDAATSGKFPAEFAAVRDAGYEKWRYVCNIAGIDPKVLNPQGTKGAAAKGKRRDTRRSATVANAKASDNAGKAQDAATALANAAADAMRIKASVETVTDLAALKSAYDVDKARIVKLQAANAKLYTGEILRAHEALIAAFNHFMKVTG